MDIRRRELTLHPHRVVIHIGQAAPSVAPPTEKRWSWLGDGTLDPFELQHALIGLCPTLLSEGQLKRPLELSTRLASNPDLMTPQLRLVIAEFCAALGSTSQAEEQLRAVEKVDATLVQIRMHRYLLRALVDARRLAYHGAEPNARTASRMAEQVGDYETAIRALTILAYAAFALGRSSEVPSIVAKGLRLCRSHGRTGREGHLHHALLCAQQSLGNDSVAKATIKAGLKSIRSRPTAIHGVLLARFGRACEGYGDRSLAEELYREGLSLLHGSDLDPNIAEVRTYLGDSCSRRGDYAEAYVHHSAAARIRRESADPLALSTSLRGAGVAALNLGEITEAEKHLGESMRLSDITGSIVGTGSSAVLLAKVVATRGDSKRALQLMGRAVKLLSRVSDRDLELSLPPGFSTLKQIVAEYERMKSDFQK